MKKLVLSAALMLSGLAASAQTIVFWTNDADILPVQIYVDEQLAGTITEAFADTPEAWTDGTLTIETSALKHELTAVNVNGHVYEGWPGTVTPSATRVNYIKLGSLNWTSPNRAYYPYVNWWYYSGPVPPPGPHRMGSRDWNRHMMGGPGDPDDHYGDGRYYDDDDDDEDNLVGYIILGAAAATAGIITAVAAIRNWNYPDGRFPYVSAGYNIEYVGGLDEIRNLARFKGRVGNLGGMSFIAEAGVATWLSAPGPIDPAITQTASGFTWDIGASFAYSGFDFDVRWRPNLGGIAETFLVADFSYDWWIDSHWGINFHGGFGAGGHDRLGSGFAFPAGIGVNWKF